MDADTRHQLKQNELADALERLRDFSDKRTLGWIAAILVLLLAYAGYKFWGWRQAEQRAQACQTLLAVNVHDVSQGSAPLDQLRRVISDNRDPALTAIARLRLAEGLDARGRQADGADNLDKAEQEYKTILTMTGAPNHVRAAAEYRLGVLYETRREFDQARETYTSITRNPSYVGSPFKDLAKARLNMVEDLKATVHFKPGVKPLPAPKVEAVPSNDVAAEAPSGETVAPAAESQPTPEKSDGQAPAAEPDKPQQP